MVYLYGNYLQQGGLLNIVGRASMSWGSRLRVFWFRTRGLGFAGLALCAKVNIEIILDYYYTNTVLP